MAGFPGHGSVSDVTWRALEEEITKCIGRGSSKGVASRSYRCWEAKTVSHPITHPTPSHSNSLESACFATWTMYDGYNNETFLMFVPNICIISSHKLSSDRIRHESDMRTSSSLLCLVPHSRNLQSTIQRLPSSLIFLALLIVKSKKWTFLPLLL